MKLQFDSSQEYQIDAIQAVVNVFEGQPLAKDDFQVTLATNQAGLAFTDTGVAINLVLSDDQILENTQRIQTSFNENNRYADEDGQEHFFSRIDPSESLVSVKTDN